MSQILQTLLASLSGDEKTAKILRQFQNLPAPEQQRLTQMARQFMDNPQQAGANNQVINRHLGWAQIFDVPFSDSFQRNIILGDGPYFGVQLCEYAQHPDPSLSELFDHRTECNVGVASGATVKATLHTLSQRSSEIDQPAPLPSRAIKSAFSQHKERVVRALSEATLYRGKTKFVMWADKGNQVPTRMARAARAWGMRTEMRDGHPVYVREVAIKDM